MRYCFRNDVFFLESEALSSLFNILRPKYTIVMLQMKTIRIKVPACYQFFKVKITFYLHAV